MHLTHAARDLTHLIAFQYHFNIMRNILIIVTVMNDTWCSMYCIIKKITKFITTIREGEVRKCGVVYRSATSLG